MKFLTFTDLHEDKKKLQELVKRASKPDIDFIVCCGDISSFGRGLRNVLKSFNDLGKKMYVLPGNHEEPDEAFAAVVSDYENCVNLHMKTQKIGNYLFLGYGGGGFAMQDERFRKVARDWYSRYKNEKTVLVTHMPPFETKLDKLEMGHVGNKDYRNFIKRMKPKLAISGHLHETVGQMDKIENTKIINPGWDGMVIELK
jgi:uncharacterized protein